MYNFSGAIDSHMGLFTYSHFGSPGGNWGENKWLLMKQTSATATYDKLY